MCMMLLALGVILGIYPDHGISFWIVFICIILSAFSWVRAQQREEEQEELEAAKHSFYYGYKYKK